MRFLVLRLNTIQRNFEFEFIPFDSNDRFLAMLRPGMLVDREELRSECAAFRARQMALFLDYNEGFQTTEPEPGHVIVLSTARFSDNHYSMRSNGVSVVALGNWRRTMAPPSILEFVLTLVVREALACVSRRLSGSVHLGTKGCPCDVTPLLADARQKVLSSYLCSYCRTLLAEDGLVALIPAIEKMLDKSWLGTPHDQSSPAGIASALGHDLFIVKGLRPTLYETIRITLRQEGIKQLISTGATILATILVAIILVRLGLKV
ncbi:hypothetical protein Rhe02_78330 [Rhizocola hellebori]|uniref:Uncharacterized protein n=1 Tax=Rhizocola hellebori TaxID=1392758 RepID=A0A8J3QFN8_9ACTN|nr:hypothetical protein Rhe02_78330 [Rhizocola hellebori]